jgi:hypothetical protein
VLRTALRFGDLQRAVIVGACVSTASEICCTIHLITHHPDLAWVYTEHPALNGDILAWVPELRKSHPPDRPTKCYQQL